MASAYSPANIERALAGSAEDSAAAIAELRGEGPAALAELVHRRDELKAALDKAERDTNPAHLEKAAAEIQRLDELIDAVGGARYCSVSKLYWYTDFEKAKAAAAKSNKPILCLRMMGNLNEEFSCANSRFFRTTLYANEQISQTLRDKFVLHWESVRPVPKVTIDFGDGRKLERTLTGNSIHYVVDREGRPLDGLPGLYGPQAFKQWLSRAEQLHREYLAQPPAQREELLQNFHKARLAAIAKAFQEDLKKIATTPPPAALPANTATQPQGQGQGEVNQAAARPLVAPRAAVPAAEAAKVARPKEMLERGIIRLVAASPELPSKMGDVDDAMWQKIAALHAEDATLDAASVRLIRSENPDAVRAGLRAFGKARIEDPLARLVRNFQNSISVDTVRNEYVLHHQLHEWFVAGTDEREVKPLNDRVYAALFLTPNTDPWLGLMTPNTYSALRNDGVKVEK
jgi:hypothetical protein